MIKNLLFDLGGVIMDICRENAVKALEGIGMAGANDFLGEYSQKGPFLALEDGSMSAEEFRAEIRKHINGEVTDDAIDAAFCEFLVGIPVHRLVALRELRKRYKIYILSNTNPIMWDTRIAEEFRHEGKDMSDYFDGIVTSFEAKCIKPDAKIFETAIEQCQIVPEETIFLDDSQKNLNAAAMLGFNTLLVTPGAEFADLLSIY